MSTTDRPSTAGWRRWITVGLGVPTWVGMLGVAVAALFMVSGGTSLYGGIGWLDPWIYTAYINEYGDTLARFGRTYYSTRVTAIWPQGVLYSIIGEPAYVFIRWLVLFGAGSGLALAIRALGSRWIGYFAGIALVFFSPLLLSLTNDYTQPVAIAYAMLAFAAIVRERPIAAVLAGVLSSAAIGAHEISIYLIAPMVVSVVALALTCMGVRAFLRRAALFALGVIGLQIVLSLLMGGMYGWVRTNVLFQETAVRFAVSLGQGEAARWKVSWDNPYERIMSALIVTLIWLAIATLAMALIRRGVPRRLLGSTIALAVLLAMVLVAHFVFEASFVGTDHTILIAAVATLVCAWVALSALVVPQTEVAIGGVALAIAITWGFLATNPAGPTGIREQIWWGSVAIALATAVLVLAVHRQLGGDRSRMILAVGATVVAGITIPLAPLTAQEYNGARPIGNVADTASGADLRRVGISVQKVINDRVPPGVPMVFWYPGPWGQGEFNSIQSLFLWQYSCLLCDQAHTFPEIPEEQLAPLRDGAAKVFVALAPSRSLAAQASTIAGTAPLPFTQHDAPVRVASGYLSVWVAISARPETIPAP